MTEILDPKPWMDVPEGIYAMRPSFSLDERLILFRRGKWHHLYVHPEDGAVDPYAAEPERIAETAHREGRLTRLVPEVSDVA